MMTPEVQNYIEKNSNLLESDLRAFIAKSRWSLNNKNAETLVAVLKEAEVDVTDILKSLLLKHLDFVFETVNDGTSLMQFIGDQLYIEGNQTTDYGFTANELKQLILDNQDMFKDTMYLEKDFAGLYIIRTNYEH